MSSPRHKKNPSKKKKAAVPLAPPPHLSMMKSRKRARQVTTLFHKYTREKDLAIRQGADPSKVQEYDDKINAMGGRPLYQQASQLSTSFHSTSKWVLGCLQQNGWLYGIPLCSTMCAASKNQDDTNKHNNTRKKKQRRQTRLLEVGAINTELLDASERLAEPNDGQEATINNDKNSKKTGESSTYNETNTNNNHRGEPRKKYRLHVRAIDLHSMHPGRIEEADFLKLPLPPQPSTNSKEDKEDALYYDVIVCSMVLNCVTTPEDRGEMLARCYHFLRPGGLLFLTIPKLCITQSPYLTRDDFLKLLGSTGVGFAVEETKESPKVAFYRCKRPERDEQQIDKRWTVLRKIQKGKKYRNQFAVILNPKSVSRPRLT